MLKTGAKYFDSVVAQVINPDEEVKKYFAVGLTTLSIYATILATSTLCVIIIHLLRRSRSCIHQKQLLASFAVHNQRSKLSKKRKVTCKRLTSQTINAMVPAECELIPKTDYTKAPCVAEVGRDVRVVLYFFDPKDGGDSQTSLKKTKFDHPVPKWMSEMELCASDSQSKLGEGIKDTNQLFLEDNLNEVARNLELYQLDSLREQISDHENTDFSTTNCDSDESSTDDRIPVTNPLLAPVKYTTPANKEPVSSFGDTYLPNIERSHSSYEVIIIPGENTDKSKGKIIVLDISDESPNSDVNKALNYILDDFSEEVDPLVDVFNFRKDIANILDVPDKMHVKTVANSKRVKSLHRKRTTIKKATQKVRKTLSKSLKTTRKATDFVDKTSNIFMTLFPNEVLAIDRPAALNEPLNLAYETNSRDAQRDSSVKRILPIAKIINYNFSKENYNPTIKNNSVKKLNDVIEYNINTNKQDIDVKHSSKHSKVPKKRVQCDLDFTETASSNIISPHEFLTNSKRKQKNMKLDAIKFIDRSVSAMTTIPSTNEMLITSAAFIPELQPKHQCVEFDLNFQKYSTSKTKLTTEKPKKMMKFKKHLLEKRSINAAEYSAKNKVSTTNQLKKHNYSQRKINKETNDMSTQTMQIKTPNRRSRRRSRLRDGTGKKNLNNKYYKNNCEDANRLRNMFVHRTVPDISTMLPKSPQRLFMNALSKRTFQGYNCYNFNEENPTGFRRNSPNSFRILKNTNKCRCDVPKNYKNIFHRTGDNHGPECNVLSNSNYVPREFCSESVLTSKAYSNNSYKKNVNFKFVTVNHDTSNLMDPIAETTPLGTNVNNNIRHKKVTSNISLQTNLITSSQIDLEMAKAYEQTLKNTNGGVKSNAKFLNCCLGTSSKSTLFEPYNVLPIENKLTMPGLIPLGPTPSETCIESMTPIRKFSPFDTLHKIDNGDNVNTDFEGLGDIDDLMVILVEPLIKEVELVAVPVYPSQSSLGLSSAPNSHSPFNIFGAISNVSAKPSTRPTTPIIFDPQNPLNNVVIKRSAHSTSATPPPPLPPGLTCVQIYS